LLFNQLNEFSRIRSKFYSKLTYQSHVIPAGIRHFLADGMPESPDSLHRVKKNPALTDAERQPE
jgi:hypothetical protein